MNGELNSQNLPQPGMILDGYQIVELLGMGGMGAVYKVQKHGAIYALKVILNSDESDIERFRREAVTLAAVSHPNIVKIHSLQWQGQWPYILFEFIDGHDLSSRIVPGRCWSLEESLRVLEPLASALDEIHSKGIIHRDLKPANILIADSDEKPLLTDFGIAKNQDLDTLTQQGEIVGTVSYMAPEQFDAAAVSAQTDLWALTVILYQLLSGGELPFTGFSLMNVAQQIMTKDPRSITEHSAEVPKSLCALFSKALAKDPEERYSTARAFIEDCQRVARGDSIASSQSGKRRKALLALPIIAALLVLTGLVYQQGRDWETARIGEAISLGKKAEALNLALPLHYLDHGMNGGEERKCCAEFAAIERQVAKLKQIASEEKKPWLFWVASKKIQSRQEALSPTLATLAFIHTKDPKELEINETLKYKDRGLVNALVLYRKGQFERAFEAYDSLEGLSRDWIVTTRVMKASCAIQFGQFKEAADLLNGLGKLPGRGHIIRQLKQKTDINLSITELFKGTGSVDRSRALLGQLIKSGAPPESLFSEWNRVFEERFQQFKPKSAFRKESAILKHRELSYDFPLIKELTLSEETLRLCLKSAKKRLDRGSTLIYCSRIKKLNPAFPIPKTFDFAFLDNGELDYSELCIDIHRRIGLRRGRLLNHFKMVLEAGRQGIFLEGFDDLKWRALLAKDRSVVDFVNRKENDPFLRFWRSFIRPVDGTEKDLSQFDDFNFVVNHKRVPGVLKAIALTEHVRRICVRFSLLKKVLPKEEVKICCDLLDKAATLPHSRPNVIEILRFNLLFNSCESRTEAQRLSKSMFQCLARAEAALTLRLTLTEERKLLKGRPEGQPYGRLIEEVYRGRLNRCTLGRGRLHFKLQNYQKALDKLLHCVKRSPSSEPFEEILVCIEKLSSFKEFDKLLNSIEHHLGRTDLERSSRLSLESFKGRILSLKKSRE